MAAENPDGLPRGLGLRRGDPDDYDVFSKHGLRGAEILEWNHAMSRAGDPFMVVRLKNGCVITLTLGFSIGGDLTDEGPHDAGCKCYTCKYSPKKAVRS